MKWYVFKILILLIFAFTLGACKINQNIDGNSANPSNNPGNPSNPSNDNTPPAGPETISLNFSMDSELSKGSSYSFTSTVQGTVESFSIDNALPAGLNFDTQTGTISGIPTEEFAETTYTITANFADGRTLSQDVTFAIPQEITTIASFGATVDSNPGDGVCADGSGDCTMLAAITEANARAPIPAKINVSPGTYLVSGQSIEVLTNTTFIGADKSTTILDGQNAIRVMSVADGVKVNISDVTIQQGRTSAFNEPGAAIKMGLDSNLNLSNCSLLNNLAQFEDGGAIYSEGNVNIDNCIFDNNDSSNGISYGGAIAIYEGSWNFNQSLTITNSEIKNSSSPWDGGAIFSEVDVNVENTLFENNICDFDGGAIFSEGSVTVKRSRFLNNTAGSYGGAILTDGWSDNFNLIEDSYFESNTASYRGGAINFDFFTNNFLVKNSTFVNNSTTNATDGQGGTIFVGAAGINNLRKLEHVTISGSSAPFRGAAISMSLGKLSLFATIINDVASANNCFADSANSAEIISLGYNIDSGNSCGLSGQAQAGDLENTDPLLSASGPQLNGDSSILNILLDPSSPGLDAIPLADCSVDKDVRGMARPQASACDIGATEQ